MASGLKRTSNLIEKKYMKKDDIFLVDTNVIVYAYEMEESERKNKALKILEKCYNNEITLALSNQNLAEFSVVSLKKLKLNSGKVKETIRDISNFAGFKKLFYTDKTVI